MNAAIALRARDEVPASRKQPLTGYAQVRDAELGVALRARRIGVGGDPRLRLDFFAVEDIAARRLFDMYPRHSAGDQSGPGGDQRLRYARPGGPARGRAPAPGAARPPAGRGRASGTRAEGQVAKVTDAFPAIAPTARSRTPELPEFPAAASTPCTSASTATTTRSARAWPWPTRWSASAGDVVVCMRESSPFAGVLAARSGLINDVMGRLSVFGVIEEACVPANIATISPSSSPARSTAPMWPWKTAHGKTPATNPSMVPWESLPEDLRQANIAQAAGIGDKMEAIGAIIVPESAGAPEFQLHRRGGRAPRRARARAVDARQAQPGLDVRAAPRRRAQDPPRPAALGRPSGPKDKDRNAIRTLPETLRDAGFQILRLPPDS